MNLKDLTDEALLSETKKLVAQEREILVVVLNHLREIERRRLFSSLGFSSLFAYAVGQLGYSEDQAQSRISAMRLLRDLPQLEEKVQSGKVSLTNLSMAQSLFRKEEKVNPFNHEQKVKILEKLENKTSREAEKIVAQHSTQPLSFVTERMRAVAVDIVEVKFAITEELKEKIETVKGLLAHSNPNISMAELLDKLCDLGIQKWDPAKRRSNKKTLKLGSVGQKPSPFQEGIPETASAKSPWAHREASLQKSKSISAEVRRLVWQRAQSKCENCHSKHALQMDHKVPRALGGSDDPENLRLLCRSCNQRAAIKCFGVGKMESYFESKRRAIMTDSWC